MLNLSRSITLLSLSLLGAGCKRPAPTEDRQPPPMATSAKPKPAPEAAWKDTYFRPKVEGMKAGAELRTMVLAGSLRVDAVYMPSGTRVEVDGLSLTLDDKKPLESELKVPLDGRLATLAWDELKPDPKSKYHSARKMDWKVPLTLTLPGYEPIQTTVPAFVVTTKLDDFFIELANGKRSWPEGANASPPPKAAAWAFGGFMALGDAKQVRDVRFVVVGEMSANERTMRCGGYVGASDFDAGSYDVKIDVVDRVTKQVVATQKFAGQPSCPTTVYVSQGQAPSHSSGPSHEVMQAWVVAQLPRLVREAK